MPSQKRPLKSSKTFCQIIGTGSVEPCKGRNSSGVLLVFENRPFLVDVTPQNWEDFGDWLYHEEARFFVTHGHPDHFQPKTPWSGIFNPLYANFGKDSLGRHLYAPRGVVELLLTYNGFNPKQPGIQERGISHEKDNECYHRLVRKADGRTLHLHIVQPGKGFAIGALKVSALDSLHSWSYPERPPQHVHNAAALGYIFNSPDKSILYMSDFDVDSKGRLKRNITEAINSSRLLEYFIVGCPNPCRMPTATAHAGPKAVYGLYQELAKSGILTNDTVVVLTHRNPNWEVYPFENPGFPEDRFVIAERGQIFPI